MMLVVLIVCAGSKPEPLPQVSDFFVDSNLSYTICVADKLASK